MSIKVWRWSFRGMAEHGGGEKFVKAEDHERVVEALKAELREARKPKPKAKKGEAQE